MQKRGYLFIFIFLFFHNLTIGTPRSSILNNLNDLPVYFTQIQSNSAVIVISPNFDTLELSIQLYKKLYRQLGNQVYLIVSPDLPFFIPNFMVTSELKQNIQGEAASGVLLDWDQQVTKKFVADDSEQPVVLRLEKDGTILGRYHYQVVEEAFEFMVYTFPSLFNPPEFLAKTSTPN